MGVEWMEELLGELTIIKIHEMTKGSPIVNKLISKYNNKKKRVQKGLLYMSGYTMIFPENMN